MSNRPRQFRDKRTGQLVAMANVSRYHPDYGMTVAQHVEAKAEREAGNRKFDPKEARRARLKPLADRLGAGGRV